jgi:transcriptional antiterminator Rof (Rho-off)
MTIYYTTEQQGCIVFRHSLTSIRGNWGKTISVQITHCALFTSAALLALGTVYVLVDMCMCCLHDVYKNMLFTWQCRLVIVANKQHCKEGNRQISGLKYRLKLCYLSHCCLTVHYITATDNNAARLYACFLATVLLFAPVTLSTELKEDQVRSLSNAEMELLKLKEDQVRSLSNAELELLKLKEDQVRSLSNAEMELLKLKEDKCAV